MPVNPISHPTVMLVAGEASGDLHAARLVHALSKMNPAIRFIGMGGAQMRSAGVELLVDSSSLAVVGLIEVIAHYPALHSALDTLRRALREEPPDLVVLVDYPEFNLKLAKTAKQVGAKVLYYVSPQVWAWRRGRVQTIAQRVDMMAVLFPFEVAIYEQAGVPVRFTGHPLADDVKASLSRPAAFEHFELDPGRRVVGLLPGSRHSEIKRLLAVQVAAARLLERRFPDLQFILPLAPSLSREDITSGLEGSGLEIRLVEHHTYDAINLCDAIITASGTATLQIGLLGVPMAIMYKVAPVTYWVARLLVRSHYIGMVNIVLGGPVVREFIQHEARPQLLADEIDRLLTDVEYAQRMRDRLATLKQKLAKGATVDIATLANEMLQGDRPQ